MFTGSEKDRKMIAHMQAEMRREADERRLAAQAEEDEEMVFESKKWMVRVVLIVVAAVALFAGFERVHALDTINAGEGDSFAEAMLAYRMGHYFTAKGDYERAVERLSEAIALMPEEIFSLVPAYSEMYWVLGEAQEAAGLFADALVSYQQFLTLAGDDAADWTMVKVQELQNLLEAMLIADARA